MRSDHPGGGAGREHQHPVAQGDGFLQVVGDEHDRFPVFLPQTQEVVLHQFTGLDVERAERLIHQEDRRADDQALRQRHPLPHAAGELVGKAALESREPHAAQPPAGLVPGAAGRPAVEERPEHDVLERGLPRQQDVLLEQVGGVTVDLLEGRAERQDPAARGAEQAGGQAEDGGLSAPGRADDRQKLPESDGERHALDGRIRGPSRESEMPADGVERERRRGALGRRHGGPDGVAGIRTAGACMLLLPPSWGQRSVRSPECLERRVVRAAPGKFLHPGCVIPRSTHPVG